MAFTRETYNVIVQPVGGDGIRFVSYRTDDTAETVTGAGYFVGVATSGARVSDLVFVTPLTGPGDPYAVVLVDIDEDGNGTAELSPSDTALQPSDIGVTVQGWRAGLDAITSYGFSLTAADDEAEARTVLGLGTAATQNSSAFATAAQGALADSSLQPDDIGVSVQAHDADLSAIAALASAANKLPYATGAQTWALTDLSAFGRTLIDDADAATARTTLSASALRYAAAAKSADYTVVIGDIHGTLTVNSTGANRTVNLLAAATALSGFTITVVKADSSANTVTIDGNGSETIDGATTKVLRLPYQSATLLCDGTQWVTVAETNTVLRGSDSNGDYERFADGTQFCWFILSTAAAGNVDTAVGSMFWQNAVTTWTYPVAFSSAPVVPEPGGVRTDTICGGTVTGVSTSGASMRAWAATSVAASIALRCFAAGRWF